MSSLTLIGKNIAAKTGKSVVRIQELNIQNKSFWQFGNNRDNLLIVLKFKHKELSLGGFSSCTCKLPPTSQTQNIQHERKCFKLEYIPQFQVDQKLASFLFYADSQQIKIYNLKENCEKFAIYCDQNDGPIFGAGPDLKINSSFEIAFWNPDGSYELNRKDLKGVDQKIEIEKFQVYQITLKY